MNYLAKWQEKHGLTADGLLGKNTSAAMMEWLGITKIQFCHLIAQIEHESAEFTAARENLNYSADGLMRTWPSRFNLNNAQQYHRQLEKIANKAYANRMGNGDEASGDGWKYRGIFGLQLTGKSNIQAFMKTVNVPIDSDPESLLDNPDYYFQAGNYFFDKNNLYSLCKDVSDATIKAITKRVNGGTIGLNDRIKKTKKVAGMLGV